MSISRRLLSGLFLFLVPWPALAQSANQPPPLLSDLVDVSPDFRDYTERLLPGRQPRRLRPGRRHGLAHVAAPPALPPDRLRQHGGRPAAVRRGRLPGQGVRDEPGAAVRDPARVAADGAAPPAHRPPRPAGRGVAHARARAGPRLVLGGHPRRGRIPLHERRGLGHRPREALARGVPRRRGAAPDPHPAHLGLRRDPRARAAVLVRAAQLRLLAERGRRLLAVARREDLRQRRVVHAPRQARPEGRAVGERRQRRADRAHVQADPVLPEQPGLRHVRPHLGPGHLRHRGVVPRRRTRCCWATTSWTCSSSSAHRRRSSTSTRRSPASRRCRRSGRSASG